MNKLVIDVTALKRNIAAVIKQADGTPIYGVIKGGGYGLGLVPYAKLLHKEGITRFAVTDAHDAASLRNAGLETDEILMLKPTCDENELKTLIDNSVILTIASNDDAVAASGVAEQLQTVVAVHIKVDTGMGRYGFLPEETDKIASIYKYMQRLAVCGIYTHLHSAFSSKTETQAQFAAFQEVLSKLHTAGYETGVAHIANSSALYRHPEMKMDAVRVGSAFLGRLSFKGGQGLTKIGWAEAPIEEIRWLPKGSTVGYGAVYKTKRPTQIAVLPIGWYHGVGMEKARDVWRVRDCVLGCLSLIKSALKRKALYVSLNGQKARVLGHVSMVSTVIDVTNIACVPGDTAKLDINPLLAKDLEIEYR